MLTGQAKIDFEKFLCFYGTDPVFIDCETNGEVYAKFDTIHFNLQQGLILEWLRSVGIELSITYSVKYNDYYYWLLNHGYLAINDSRFPDYNTTLTEAITKAGEIYNRGVK